MVTPYQPLYIKPPEVGLVQSRQEFVIPQDAYPTLQNAYVWRERIKRRQGYELLGRLQRQVTANFASVTLTVNFKTQFSLETTASFVPGTFNITVNGNVYTEPTSFNGTLLKNGVADGSLINYSTMLVILAGGAGVYNWTGTFSYYPGLPVMGLRIKELDAINNELTVAFDTKYAYIFQGVAWKEWIPGTTWTGTDSDFFWSTNYWTSKTNAKVFWVTNFTVGDPIRYTDSSSSIITSWVDFAPTIDAAGNKLEQCLAMLPFRGRMMVFNTLEGANLGAAISYPQRIRWAAIGTPFSDMSALVTSTNPNAWRDDIRGQGGFLDIPTTQNITAVGFVRDNLVIYCERSTWQLRYTGRSIAPFQIEKVNSELGAESTFSAVQFDTSLVGVGDKGIIECDSFKSDRIDVKIPDLVFNFQNQNNGTQRVHGIRDFVSKLAYWIYPSAQANGIYPDSRLVYNYDNDSWAIFSDSLTCLGTFQPPSNRTWANTHLPWRLCNFSWANRPALIPDIIAGNQQGFVEYIGEALDGGQTSNDSSLFISAITGSATAPVLITSPNHNMQTGFVVSISNIPSGTAFATALNGNVFGIVVANANQFSLYTYDTVSQLFDTPFIDNESGYIGNGLIQVRDNFSIVSKKFNFMEQGQSIQIGYIDVLMPTTAEGAITLNVYQNYDENAPTNTLPENNIEGNDDPDVFFNSVIPTSASDLQTTNSTKTWQRVFCATRAQFLTLEYTLSNAQMNGVEQENRVEIDAQIIWQRPGGRMSI
jgi:hypothetical protein